MDALDMKVSRKLQKILRRVEQLVEKEVGEPMGIGLVVFPYTRPGELDRVAEYQYVSNNPRKHMHAALKALLKKWDSGAPSIPPHEKQ